jgi:hypothetical protein
VQLQVVAGLDDGRSRKPRFIASVCRGNALDSLVAAAARDLLDDAEQPAVGEDRRTGEPRERRCTVSGLARGRPVELEHHRAPDGTGHGEDRPGVLIEIQLAATVVPLDAGGSR